jgi:hypothetical protein
MFNHHWLVVSTPLKNDGLRQLGWWNSQSMGKYKIHVPVTTNQTMNFPWNRREIRFCERPLGDPTSALAGLIHAGRALMDHIPRWINWEVPDREHGKTSANTWKKYGKNMWKSGKISEIWDKCGRTLFPIHRSFHPKSWSKLETVPRYTSPPGGGNGSIHFDGNSLAIAWEPWDHSMGSYGYVWKWGIPPIIAQL